MQFQPRNAREARCTLFEVNSDSRNLPCESYQNYQTGLSVRLFTSYHSDRLTDMDTGGLVDTGGLGESLGIVSIKKTVKINQVLYL